MKLKAFFDHIRATLDHPNLYSEQQDRYCTAMMIAHHKPLPPNVVCCDSKEALHHITNSMAPRSCNSLRATMAYFLNQAAKTLDLQETQAIAFLPSRPLTVLYTRNLDETQRKVLFQQLKEITERLQQSLLTNWHVTYKNDYAYLETEQPNYLIEVLTFFGISDQEDTLQLFNYAQMEDPLAVTTASLNLKAAELFLAQCNIRVKYKKETKEYLTDLCQQHMLANTDSEERLCDDMQKISKFTTNILARKPIGEAIKHLGQFCHALEMGGRSNALSNAILLTLDNLSPLLMRTLRHEPALPVVGKRPTHKSLEALHESFSIRIPMLVKSLPHDLTEPGKSLVLKTVIDIDAYLKAHSVVPQLIEEHKGDPLFLQSIINMTLSLMTDTANTLDEKRYRKVSLQVLQLAKQIIEQLQKLVSQRTRESLDDETIKIYLSEITIQMKCGHFEAAEELSTLCTNTIVKAKHLRPTIAMSHKATLQINQARMLIISGDIDRAEDVIHQINTLLKASTKSIIPKLQQREIPQYINKIQNIRYHLVFLHGFIAMHHLLFDQSNAASCALKTAVKMVDSISANDVIAIIKQRFRRRFGIILESNALLENDRVTLIRSFEQIRFRIFTAHYLDASELFSHISRDNDHSMITLLPHEQIIRVMLANKDAATLSKALNQTKIPFQTNKKKRSKHTTLLFDNFLNIDPLALKKALSSVYQIRQTSNGATVDHSDYSMPQSSSLLTLKYQLLKAMLESEISGLSKVRHALHQASFNSEKPAEQCFSGLLAIMSSHFQALLTFTEQGTLAANQVLEESQEHQSMLAQEHPSFEQWVQPIVQPQRACTENYIQYTLQQHDISMLEEQFNTLTAGCLPDENLRFTTIHSIEDLEQFHQKLSDIFDALLKKFKTGSKTRLEERDRLLKQLGAWMLRASGEMYLTSILDEERTQETTERFTAVLSKLDQVPCKIPTPSCPVTAAYYHLGNTVRQWDPNQPKRMIKKIQKTMDYFEKLQDADLMSNLCGIAYVLYVKLNIQSPEIYTTLTTRMLKCLMEQYHDLRIAGQPSSSILNFMLETFHMHLTDPNHPPKEWVPLCNNLTTLVGPSQGNDTPLNTYMTELRQTMSRMLACQQFTESLKDTSNSDTLIATSRGLPYTLLKFTTLSRQITHAEEGEQLDTTYDDLHTLLVSTTEYLNQITSLTQNLSLGQIEQQALLAMTTAFQHQMDDAYHLIRSTILPKLLKNGLRDQQQAVEIDPYNWYCLVRFDYFPHNNTQCIFTVLERLHDLTKGSKVDEQELALLITLCDTHPDNPFLQFSMARYFYGHDRQNSEGFKKLQFAAKRHHPLAEYYLGKVFHFGFFQQEQSPDNAVAHFKQAADEFHHYQSFYRLAKHYKSIGDQERMVEFAEKAIEYCPLGTEVQNRLRRRFLGVEEEKAPAGSRGRNS